MDIETFYRQLGKCDGVLRGIMVSHPQDVSKSDGFLFVLNCRVLLIDGGMKGCTDTRDRLLRLREAIAPGSRLRITWVLTHYHGDHVRAAVDSLLPDPAFEFEEIFLPPKTGIDSFYTAHTETAAHRRLQDCLAAHQPKAVIHTMGFADRGGFRAVYEYAGAKVTVLPPDTDWSRPEVFDSIIVKDYYGGSREDPHAPSDVVNSASLWTKISYAGRRLVFTGDSIKRTREHTDENFDCMLALWRHYFEHADFVKWPHHGEQCDYAAPGLLSLHPQYFLTTCEGETASAYTAANYPEEAAKVRFVNCARSDVYLEIYPDGELNVYDSLS